jgi:FtsH-binding integral membrane protein
MSMDGHRDGSTAPHADHALPGRLALAMRPDGHPRPAPHPESPMSAVSLPIASAPATDRARFIRRTYGTLALAILAFAVVEWLLLRWDGARDLAGRMTEGYNWLFVLLAFGVVSGIAGRWANGGASVEKQLAGLALAVVAQAVLFLPLLVGLDVLAGGDVLPTAAIITALLVAGLTAVVVVSRSDFSFLRTGLIVGGLVGLGLIVSSIVFGFGLGPLFSWAMVALAAGSILYTTGNVLRTYRTDQHIAAALALFASVASLLWWVTTIVRQSRG